MTMAKRPGNNKANRDPPRFDVATLHELAGEKVFARGVAYHEDGRVEIVSIDNALVVARVIGSEVYHSQLVGTGKKFSGGCSCAAFFDWGFCKHLVATALAANDSHPVELEKATNRLTKMRDFLRAKGVEPLVEMIMGIAERDPGLLRDIELSATAATADDQTLFVQFKKAITEATRTHGFVDYREARAWAAKIERILEQIEALIQSGRADLILRLLDHFYARMDDALNKMDDSDGQDGGIYAKACKIHLAACRASKPEPVALARELFGREVDSDWDFFHGASETYADVLGDAGLAEYRRLANEAWRTVKPLRAVGRQMDDDQVRARHRLGAVLECFAARDGDVDARIAIRAKDLSTAYAYLGIAQLCLDHGRDAEALKWAEEGLWQFEDHPDQHLVFFSADLYRRIGREKDADELLWRTFERLPSIELYRRLKSAASSGMAAAAAVCDRVIELLRAKLDQPEAKARWPSPRELLLQVLVSEKRLDEAWEVVRGYGCSEPQLVELAKASEHSYPDAALSAYAQSVERLVGLGGQPNYEEASKLIARMQSIRERLDASAEHARFLADFMRRHKAKRNMMKLL
jgi:uncharacterized Zn finger protein